MSKPTHVEFSDYSGDPVFVNPALVRVLRPSATEGLVTTILYFDNAHSVVVRGEIDDIASKLWDEYDD